MIQNFMYNIPVKIYFGKDSLHKLAEIELPGKKALIVTTGGGSVIRSGALNKTIGYLQEKNIDSVVFDKVTCNPDVETISEGKDAALENGCDFILGLGGGSAIDGAKAIAVLCKNGGCFWDYLQRGSGGRKKPFLGALPIVAVTTTAGTGTEVDPWLVVTNKSSQEKIGCGWDFTFPSIAIIDPMLMTGIPPLLTAFQGMDAFFHAVEGYLAACATAGSEPYSLQAVNLLAKSLPKAVLNGNDLEARTDVAWASTAAGIVETLSDTMSLHYISHVITARYDMPHGAALTALSVAYMKRMVCGAEWKMDNMALAMEQGDATLKKDTALSSGIHPFVYYLENLIEKTGLSKLTLGAYGVHPEEAQKIAQQAFDTDGILFDNSPVVLSQEEVVGIICESIG